MILHLARTTLLFAALPLLPLAQAAEDILLADFEGPDYGNWTTTGTAFGPGPARGALPGQMAVDGFQGKGLVNSFHGGDASVGTLTSPEFKLERRYLSFLVGGGKDPERTSLNLVVDGRVVRTATGPNDRAGGSEALHRDFWDLAEFLGQSAKLHLIDQATGGWGHINVDHLLLTDRKPPGTLTNATRAFVADQRYLLLPIRNGAPKRVVTTLVDGQPQVRNDIELADGEADWWAAMDLQAWSGKTITLRVDQLAEDSQALANIRTSDSFPQADTLYREPTRQQFHFSPRRGWNNDPNGLVFYEGEYHLFFQHNPYGWGWGNMHWGHAVSRDLVHWQELGDKLAPDPMGPMFSGSAVVDWKNTSGLGQPNRPPLVLLYTAAGDPAVQCLASSTDGRSFAKFPGNPVVPQFTPGNRDPKVIWHPPTERWVMTLYVETNKTHSIFFLTSHNLRDWSLTSRTDGFYECPDFFELPVDGDPSKKKWVLTAASSEYQIGSFDGRTFTPESPKLTGHRGRGFYAAQTFADIPATDGRRIQIGWFQTETKGMPFNQSMTVPLELKLLGTPEGPRLTWTPVRELATLRARSFQRGPLPFAASQPNPLADIDAELVDLQAEFTPEPGAEISFSIRGAEVLYDTRKAELVVNGHRAPAPLRDGKQRLRILVDRAGLEIFASDGLSYIPFPFIPKPDNRSLRVGAAGAGAHFQKLDVHLLNPAWPHP